MPEPIYPKNDAPSPPPYPQGWGAQQAYDAPVVSTGEWLVIHILLWIPIVNLILLIVWSFDQNANPNRVNFAKANLILIGIKILIAAFFIGMFMGLILRYIDAFNYI
ncbi:MAG: hypothetical protein PHI68_01825 [Candidatus Cloacimonetes bacterium]|nr:hypothetical protein [Candidatus Cloacimonadota bacterium]